MGPFVLKRLLGSAALLVIVPSLALVFFQLTIAVDGRSVPAVLGQYLSDTFLRLDFGQARRFGNPDIRDLIRTGVPTDVSLLLGAMVFGVGGGTLAGAWVAAHPRRRRTAVLQIVGAVALAAPVATTGAVIVAYFGSAGAGGLPFVSDTGVYRPLTEDPVAWLHALWVPWLAVGLPVFGAVMRVAAASTRDALSDDAVRTARAKGLKDGRVLRRHAVPLSVGPLSAYGGATINLVILNAAIVESLFNLPGAFRYAGQAIEDVDLPLLQALTLVTVFYVVVGNLIADVVHARIDPRVR